MLLQENTCNFYRDCVESRYNCGPGGYPIGYGEDYCQRFSNVKSQFSPAGQAWVTKVMFCLQEKLVPIGSGQQMSTCQNIREMAFGTHPECYVKSGVCKLPVKDWTLISKTVDLQDAIGSAEALKATLDTFGGCAEFYGWLLGRLILKVVDHVKDAVDDTWHDIVRWF